MPAEVLGGNDIRAAITFSSLTVTGGGESASGGSGSWRSEGEPGCFDRRASMVSIVSGARSSPPATALTTALMSPLAMFDATSF